MSAARKSLVEFVSRCRRGPQDYALTPDADASPFARCFAVYCRALCLQPPAGDERQALAAAVRSSARQARRDAGTQVDGKPYRQLLAFTLSALRLLDALEEDPLADLVEELLPDDIGAELERYGCLRGVPGSGNHAMFAAIFLLHARDRLGIDTQPRVDTWVGLHLRHMNRFGFWGPARGMTHLQFQNGYHQYEILEYLGVENPRAGAAATAVRALADPAGHFAPYPGGGGCFDYDAVFVLTPGGRLPDTATAAWLGRTAESVLSERCANGGFAESRCVRPRTPAGLVRWAAHVARAGGNAALLAERLRYGLTLQRPAHDRIRTHWSRYSREWHEANLWDSWFRMLTVARIEAAFDPEAVTNWGFIDYPGIGFHPGVRRRTAAA